MYGMMGAGGAGQRQKQKQGSAKQNCQNNKPRTSPAPPRDQNAEEKTVKKERGFTETIIDYIQKKINPQLEEDIGETGTAWWGGRHRAEPPAPSALAQATRFTTHEIKLMYRGFKQECPSGVVDEDAFKHIFSQFFPLGDATQYAHFVFNTIKHKQSGKINFEEFLEILSRVARGSEQDKLAWVFALYDTDHDGRISRQEMHQVVQAIYELMGRSVVPASASAASAPAAAAKEHVDRIFNLMDINADGVVTPDELARWCARDPAVLRSLHTLDTIL